MYEKLKQLENKMDRPFLNLKDYTYPPATFDLVTSRLALHYIEHLPIIFQNVYETLKQMEPLLLVSNTLLLLLHLKACKRAERERAGSSMIILKQENALNLGLIKKLLNITAQRKNILHYYNKLDLQLQI